ncbi:MAG: DegT/DnrJ/EryC1/StrS family aminotransferase, partial [Candidatus Nitrosocaldaceae archaeon]
ALYKGRKVGSLGDAAIFSFYPTKNMTVGGDGGMITTNDEKIYKMVKKMRDVGRRSKYVHDEIGYTMRLNTINAAIGRVQLKYLDQWNEKRRLIAKRYIDRLTYIDEIILPPLPDSTRLPVYHMFVIRTKYRNELGAWLALNGVQTGIHYPIPVHRQPSYSSYKPLVDLSFTEEWSESVLSLPLYPTLSEEEQSYVIELIERFYNDKLYQQKEVRMAKEKWVSGLI